MVTERVPIKMLSEMGVRSMVGNGSEGFSGEGLGLRLREQRRQGSIDRDQERELNMYRSGSCPPTVGGSQNTIERINNGNGFVSEEELLSDPVYLSYYYSNVNLNPRLPPPVMSKEDWRFSQRVQAVGSSKVGGIGDMRKSNNNGNNKADNGEGSRSLFSMQPGVNPKNENNDAQWLDKEGDGLIGLSLGHQKSFAEIFQDDRDHSHPILGHPSHPSSCNAFDNGALHNENRIDGLLPGSNIQNMSGVRNNIVPTSQTFASVLGSSLSRSNTPDPQIVARAPSPCLPPVGVWLNNSDKKNNNGSNSFNRTSSGIVESDDLVAALSGMSLSKVGPIDEDIIAQSKLQKEMEEHQKFLFGLQGGQNRVKQNHFFRASESAHGNMLSNPHLMRNSGGLGDLGNSTVRSNSAPFLGSQGGYPAHCQNINSVDADFTGFGLGLSGVSVDPASPSTMGSHIGMSNFPLFANVSPTSSPSMDSRALGGFSLGQNLNGPEELQNLNKMGMAAAVLQMPISDPLYAQYLAGNFSDPVIGNSYLDLQANQKKYLAALFQPQKQYGMPFLGKSGCPNHSYSGNPGYYGSPVMSPVLPASPGGPGSPLRLDERSMRFPSGLRNLDGGIMCSWHSDNGGIMSDNFASSLLDEFKRNKMKSYELSDISGHVVEFSADQYGSRFIQQKLETASTEEKNMVYDEIKAHAFSLITDVFGNYVIQKFFEHGSAAQKRELANQLDGHVLALSLQMYGCRVIQKAIEVVDLDQQTKMVAELDGHIMRCVRDQNGNHVIQKCIECIPLDAIQFIIASFYDQVVTLSTHPYGCRVIQRVLEHCDDPKTQQIIMNEILQSVCILAQDQYGNYVVQHVLEHGKPHEQTAIITKLAGQIVQMSQQKFASNVVEKCLTFGGPVERQILVNEMLGTTDENVPLQAMMKDQFANYVVQKVLETCDDQQRELILSRIKVHLNALKKYTYGKHIVARVEKLVSAGERRIGLQSSYTAN